MNCADSNNIEGAKTYTANEICEILKATNSYFTQTTFLPNSRICTALIVILGCCIAIYYVALFVQTTKLQKIKVSLV